MIPIIRTRAELAEHLGSGERRPGLVPTMGALHAGHQALIRRSASENAATVVTIFVNPTQFTDPRDLERYPRDLDRDLALAAEAGATLIFAPGVYEVYPAGFATDVGVAGPSERWEGAARPGHFRGVATVVTILLNLVRPAHAYFGEKDYQQLVVVRRLHADLALPGVIVGCPTVREPDGLALSSRNVRLSEDERRQAPVLIAALTRMAELAAAGEARVDRLIAAGNDVLQTSPVLALDYLAVVDPETLEPLDQIEPGPAGAQALIAGRLGQVRLIDNLALQLSG